MVQFSRNVQTLHEMGKLRGVRPTWMTTFKTYDALWANDTGTAAEPQLEDNV